MLLVICYTGHLTFTKSFVSQVWSKLNSTVRPQGFCCRIHVDFLRQVVLLSWRIPPVVSYKTDDQDYHRSVMNRSLVYCRNLFLWQTIWDRDMSDVDRWGLTHMWLKRWATLLSIYLVLSEMFALDSLRYFERFLNVDLPPRCRRFLLFQLVCKTKITLTKQ